MSAVANADVASKSASKKKRKNKKKANDKTKPSTDLDGAQEDVDDDDADEDDTVDSASRKQSVVHDAPLPVNGSHQNPKDAPPTTINDTQSEPLLPAADGPSSETLDAMARERDSLRVELADLRNKLESMQEKHRQDTEVLKSKAKNESSAQDKHLLESLQFVQEKHKQEIDLIKTEAHDAQATKDVAEMDELRTSINSMQEQHLSEIQHLEEQAQQAQAAKDSESLQVQELRQSLASVQQKHAEDVEALKKQAGEARTEEDNSEIKQLRQLIETMRDQHKKELDDVKSQAEHDEAAKGDSGSAELDQLRSKLQETQSGKENAESAYRTLLGKVNTIKSQLGERLKADAEELSKARAEIEELLEERQNARESQQDLQATIEQLQHQQTEYESELELLRSRTNLSQSNWIKERDELVSREAYAREEFENARQAMQDWEVLAMEERSLRESLSERVLEIEDQLNSQREAYERAASERDIQSSTVDSLQRALQDIQDARKKELRELVENSQSQLDALRAQADEAKASAAAATMSLEKAQKDLERALPFEKEVKEKNLLIGKLRHEAVILNDHLTKALRFLKRGKPEDNVDRHIVTNHFLHFLTLDRSDPKKFQVLQLIAALLGWTEEQREQAGLARPGASNSMLKIPLSPFRRTSSIPSLADSTFDNHHQGSKESLAELWSDFLEREAQEGGGGGGVHNSRSGSFAMMSPTQERSASLGGSSMASPKTGRH